MIQIRAEDLLAIVSNNKYHYSLVLDKIRLFGGNWCFVFHQTSSELLTPDKIMAQRSGFHAFVDFIWAKRENRIIRVARNVVTDAHAGPGYLKGTNSINEKATLWFIYDMQFREVKRVTQLTEHEKKYPNYSRIDDTIMVDLVKKRWLPEHDECI